MASITADLGNTTQVPDDIWYSRGVPPSKSMETLFSGVSNAIQGAASTVDQTVIKSITQKADQAKDVLMDQFGLGMNGAMANLNHGQGPSAATTTAGNAAQPVQTTAADVPAGLAARGSGMGRAGVQPIFAPTDPSGGIGSDGVAGGAVPETTTVSNTGQVGAPDPALAANIANNPILSKAQVDTQKVVNAWQQGAISQGMFWATVDMHAKELRSMYPGYNAEINQIFNDAFGYHTIAGRMMSANEEAMRQNASGAAGEAQRATGLLERYGPSYLAGGGDPQALANAEANPNMGAARSIMATAMPFDAEKLKIDHQKNVLALQNEQGKVDTQQISQTYNQDASFQIRNLTKGAMVSMGGTKQNLQTFFNNTLTDIGSGKPVSQQTWDALDTGIMQLRTQAAGKLADMQGDEQYSKLPPAEREKQNQLVLGQVDALEKAVQNKDAGLVAHFGNALHLQEDQMMGRALNDDLLRTQYLTGKINQGAAQMWGIKNANEIVAHAATSSAILAGSGATTVDGSLHNVFGDTGLTAAQKSTIAQESINKQLDVISKGNMPPDQMKTWVTQNFGQGNSGFSEYWSQLKADGRGALYNQLSSPNVSKAVANLHDPQTSATYQQWMVDQGTALPGIKSGLDQVNQSNSTDPKTNYTYQFNPQTSLFTVVPPQGKATQGFGMSMTGDRTFATRNLQDRIGPLNQFLSNYSSMLKAQGKDPNDPTVGIPALMQGMGIGGQVPGDSKAPKGASGQQEAGALQYAESGAKGNAGTAAIDQAMHAAPNNADRDRMIRTMYGEAADQGDEGLRAVGHNIWNRLNDGTFGKNMGDVTRPSQYNAWMPTINGKPNGAYRMSTTLSPDSPEYKHLGEIVDGITSGQDADLTHGASHYYNPQTVAAPSWAEPLSKQNDLMIGAHRFVGHVHEPGSNDASGGPQT